MILNSVPFSAYVEDAELSYFDLVLYPSRSLEGTHRFDEPVS